MIGPDDVRAAARVLDGVAHRTPLVALAHARRARRAEAREPAARRRVQVPRRVQQDRLAPGRVAGRRLLLGQPRPGGRARRAPARPRAPRSSCRRTRRSSKRRRDARLRRRDRHLRPLLAATREAIAERTGGRARARRSCRRTTTRSSWPARGRPRSSCSRTQASSTRSSRRSAAAACSPAARRSRARSACGASSASSPTPATTGSGRSPRRARRDRRAADDRRRPPDDRPGTTHLGGLHRRLVDEVVTVTDAQIDRGDALRVRAAEARVEPSGAVGIAALLDGLVAGAVDRGDRLGRQRRRRPLRRAARPCRATR